jgi:hypothetical protein
MQVEFKFSIGQMVRITDAKFAVRVIGAIIDEGGRQYRVSYWAEAQQRVEVLRESELEAT